MVEAVRQGRSMREVARQFHVSLLTVQRWVGRAWGKRLDRVAWMDRPSGAPRAVNRTEVETENLVLSVRGQLAVGDLGDIGADAIRTALIEQDIEHVPCARTVGRILQRRGVLDGRRRKRWPSPPLGWYLPQVASERVELDSFDTITGLILRGGIEIEVLNGVSLHGGLTSSWTSQSITAASVLASLLSRWKEYGLPGYAQFDNGTIFHGPHHFPDTVSQVMRGCLLLGVIPVFAPPREPGLQNAVEGLNARWQAKVWRRFEHESPAALELRSQRWVAAVHLRAAARRDRSPPRVAFPHHFELDLQTPPAGTIIFIRRTNDRGSVSVLGHSFLIAPHWTNRLVRAEVDLDHSVIRFFALRRREPLDQPLLSEHSYTLPPHRHRIRLRH